MELVSGNTSLADLLRLGECENGRSAIIRLGRADVEQLRDCLTVQLAEVGFDENYALNERGQVLEELIDRFNLP